VRARAVRALLIFLLRVAVTAAVLGLLFRHYGIGRLFATVGHLDLAWLATGLGFAVAQVFVLAWRWRLFCLVLTGAAPRFSMLVSGVGRSLLVGQLLPATVGADAVRATALARFAGAAGAVRSVICDRLLGFLALGLMVAAELPLFAHQTGAGAATGSLAAASLAIVGGFLIGLGLRRWLGRIPLLGRAAATIADDLWQALTRPPGQLGFALGFVAHATSALAFVALVRTVDPGVSPVVSTLVILPALLILAVPISLAGWGVREAAIASGFAMFGADPVPAVTASILFGLSGPVSGAATELLGLLRPAAGPQRSGAS
jgi:glycosyltransferase 2 family protein